VEQMLKNKSNLCTQLMSKDKYVALKAVGEVGIRNKDNFALQSKCSTYSAANRILYTLPCVLKTQPLGV